MINSESLDEMSQEIRKKIDNTKLETKQRHSSEIHNRSANQQEIDECVEKLNKNNEIAEQLKVFTDRIYALGEPSELRSETGPTPHTIKDELGQHGDGPKRRTPQKPRGPLAELWTKKYYTS